MRGRRANVRMGGLWPTKATNVPCDLPKMKQAKGHIYARPPLTAIRVAISSGADQGLPAGAFEELTF